MRWWRGAANLLGGLLFLALFLTFLVQIAARFGFNRPLPWTDELAVILYLWVILWACASMVAYREHVVFDLVWNAASTGQRRWMAVAGNLLFVLLAAAALPGCWDYVHFMAREGTPVLGVSFQWVFLPLVLLLVSIVLRSALNIYDAIRGRGLDPQGLVP